MLASALTIAATVHAQEDSYLWAFDRDKPGTVPARLIAPAGWAVAAEATAPTRPHVLAADASTLTNAPASVCSLDRMSLDTGQVWARVNILNGAAGVVFRQRAADVFCMLTVSREGNRLTLTSVRSGAATDLATCALKTTWGRWHRIGVELDGRSIHCFFDGDRKLTAQDDLLALNKGGVGLAVAAGSRAQFDDFTIEVTSRGDAVHVPEPTVEVILTRDQILFRNTPLSLTDLSRQLTARFDPTQRLVLRVDRDVEFERVEQVMKAAGAIGFEKMSFDLRK
ncbi:MAG: hypothetical protein HZA91_16290 [Verrucomicrobia bacterium]|nr:hypothetical protein [Verrucomicrobiota bacterium]